MKILHVITTLDTGGAERLMVDLLPQLKDKGNQVELLLFNGVITPFRQELESKGVIIHELSRGKGNIRHTEVYNPLNIIRLRRYLRDFDVIHTHNTASQLYVPLARLLFRSSVVLVTTEHNTTNRRRSIWWFRQLDKWMYRQYDRVVCIGDSTRKNLESYLANECNACVIYNGVNTRRFIRPIKDISQLHEYVITMVAGFRPQKDQDTLIKALRRLPVNYRLQLVGDGERESQLKDLCDKMGLDSRVDFLGKRMDIPTVLQDSDVIVLSSHWEGFGLVAVEGMASGRPLIASDVDGLREVVAGAGILFPHCDDKMLAVKIQHLCEHPNEYRQVAEACQRRAMDYDISVMVNAYHELYQSL